MSYQNIIIHAGGSIETKCYTNTLESINKNVINVNKNNSTNEIILCELDCCKLIDGYIIAHDGLEERCYGLHKQFKDTTKDECLKLKYDNIFTPLFFNDLYDFINKTKINVKFIIDSKDDLDDAFINYIIKTMKEHVNKIILQVYKKTDILLVEKYKLTCLYALWKCNCVAFNNDIKNNLEYITNKKINCIGISLFFKYYEFIDEISKNNLIQLKNYKFKIFLHGEHNINKCMNCIKDGYGIFSHKPEHFTA